MVLIDTCTLLWVVSGDSTLSSRAKVELTKNIGGIFFSSISALEIGIKYKRKKLILPMTPEKWFSAVIELHGFQEIPLSWNISVKASALPDFHNDPFDRLIIATATENNMPIITPDKVFKKYAVKTIW